MERPLQADLTTDSYPLTLNMLIASLVIGAFVGIFGWLVTLFLQRFFIDPVFCASPDSASVCANGATIAWALAHLLVIGASVVAMVRFAIYRPLLVVLAVLVTVWGINSWLGGQEWWVVTLWQGLIFALAYGTYTWLARINRFWLSALTTILVVVLCRLVLTWA